jgi:predicted secreted protein
MAERTLTAADRGATIHLRPGDEITIVLDEIPGSGYRWDVEGAASGIVEVARRPAASSGAAIGGSGQATFVVTATGSGRARLRFKLWRPWEGDRSISERFDVTLRAGDRSPRSPAAPVRR